MANLTTTAQSIKKAAPFLIVVLIIIVLVGAIIYRFAQKPGKPKQVAIMPPTINQNLSQKQPASFDLNNLKISDLPKELPVYKAHSYNITQVAAKTLAASLGFEGEPARIAENTLDGTQYSWDSANQSLTVSQTAIIYQGNLSQEQSGNLSAEELETRANDFIKRVNLIDGLETNRQRTEYFSYESNLVASKESLEDAQIVEFSFDKKLSGLELVDDTPETTYTTARVRKDGKVVFFASRYFNQFSEQGSYQIKSVREAVGEIKNGQGKVVQTQVLDQSGFSEELLKSQPENIQLASMTSLRLAYFLPDNITEPLQPIFVFEGNFKSASGENGKVVIYLPAIKQGK